MPAKRGFDRESEIYPLGDYCAELNCPRREILFYNFHKSNLDNVEIQRNNCEKNCLALRLYYIIKNTKVGDL